ncbi:putative transporter, partial [Lachnellula occidentalis]
PPWSKCDDGRPSKKQQNKSHSFSALTLTTPQPIVTRIPSPSSSTAYSSGDPSAPHAATALGTRPPDLNMQPEPSGHRRRRSTLLNTTDGSARGKAPAKRNDLQEEPNVGEVADDDDMKSTSDEVELDDLSDDGLQDDEETGLTGKDKGRRKRKKRQNTQLDHRIAGETKITDEEKKEADQNVFKRSLVNGILIGLWYIFSLSISIYNKWMFSADHLDFKFPLFTTCMHMMVQFTLSSLVLFFLPQFRPRYDSISNPHNAQTTDSDLAQHEADSKKPLMTRMFYFTRIGPCGLATGLDIGLGNTSLKFITLTFYTMCKSSSLAFVLLFAFLFRLETPSWRLVAIIATMTIGVVMMVAGEVDFSTLGFILVISAAFFSGFRWGLTQILLLRNPATSNPFSSIFYLAPVMFFSLLLLAIPVEGFPALFQGLRTLMEVKGNILGPCILLFPGAIAFCMTASEFALLQRTSVVTLSIAGIFKEVVTILAAGLVFHDTLTPINISGLFVTIGAIAAYNYIKIRKMREDAQIEAHKQHVIERGTGSGSDADEESGDSEDEDWNTMEGTMITADGDIIPTPGSAKKKGESSRANGGRARSRSELEALAA